MPITKESVAERKKQLEEQRLQGLATLNAIAGALQDCDYWLQAIAHAENPTSAIAEIPAETETPAPSA